MRRLFWLTVGAGLGGYAVHKVNEAKRKLTPESMAGRAVERATALGGGLRDFAADVRSGAAERERELAERYRLPGAGYRSAPDMQDDDRTYPREPAPGRRSGAGRDSRSSRGGQAGRGRDRHHHRKDDH